MKGRKGQVLLLSVVLLAVVFGLAGAFVSYLANVQKATNIFAARAAARAAAQSGIDKAVWCLNQTSGANCGGTFGTNFTGETAVQVATSTYYTTTITTVTGTNKTITSMGYYPSTTAPIAKVILKAQAMTSSTGASFNYGLQAGQGGVTLSNNAYIIGNLYANANVVGSTGSYCTGDVWVAGGTALSPDQQDTTNNNDYVFAQTSTNQSVAQSFMLSANNAINKVSFYIKKVGSPANVAVRILADNAGVPSKSVITAATLNASNVTGSYGWVDVSFAGAPALSHNVVYWLLIDGAADASNYWTIGSDTTDSYASGTAMYSANWNASPPVWTSAARDLDFKVWTGGNTTKIQGLHVQGNAHANTLTNDVVDKDAYYQTISGTTVGGASHPGSADPGPQDLPLSDAQIQQSKNDAAAGGTIAGDYNVSGNVSLGPKKITGNLTVSIGASLTLTGTIWIQGSASFNNSASIKLDPSYGSNSGLIISDGPMTVNNNASFNGSGSSGSYIMALTTNGSLDTANPAMSLGNNSANSIFYAANGVITISNNSQVKEVTGFALSLANNANVQYESGLASVNFTSGPSGSWILQSGSTREVKQ